MGAAAWAARDHRHGCPCGEGAGSGVAQNPGQSVCRPLGGVQTAAADDAASPRAPSRNASQPSRELLSWNACRPSVQGQPTGPALRLERQVRQAGRASEPVGAGGEGGCLSWAHDLRSWASEKQRALHPQALSGLLPRCLRIFLNWTSSRPLPSKAVHWTRLPPSLSQTTAAPPARAHPLNSEVAAMSLSPPAPSWLSPFQLACVLLALAVPALASRQDMLRGRKGEDASHTQLVFGARAGGESRTRAQLWPGQPLSPSST